jgi:RHS repeat-associated protein
VKNQNTKYNHLGNIRLSYTKDPQTNVLKILEENHYYPFGLKHTNYSGGKKTILKETEIDPKRVGPSADDLYKYKYNGKEWQDELGLNFYDFGFRNYDPAIGRWMNIDPLSERRYELTTYNYVQNSPMFRFDPNGLTDFTLDKKTGEVKQVGDINDDPDRIVKTNSKGEVKKKGEGFLGFLVSKSEKGKEKVAIDGIEKGILKDGQNFKEIGAAYEIGGEGNPTQAGIESFTVKLSKYLGVEVGGAYASENNSGAITHMTIGKYKGNTRSFIRGGLGLPLLSEFYDVNQNRTSLLGHFHVHPGGTRNPSPADESTRDSWIEKYKSSIFNILINNSNKKNGYESVPY